LNTNGIKSEFTRKEKYPQMAKFCCEEQEIWGITIMIKQKNLRKEKKIQNKSIGI
jgi:hypothetical protein